MNVAFPGITISYHIVMMIILLYSAAILIETILLVNYLRLRLVKVRLSEPCSSLQFVIVVFPDHTHLLFL